MTVLTGLLSVLACLAAGLLVAVVLAQEPRGGGMPGLAGATQGAFDTSTAPVRRLTSALAGTWIAACSVLALVLC